MNDNLSSRRIKYIDTAKGIGIIIIVICHMLRNGMVFTQLMPMSVPLFFFLSGVTFHYKGFKAYFQKKISSLMIPYFFCGSISILIYSLLGKFAGHRLGVSSVSTAILPNLFRMLYANSKNDYMKWNNSLWFLPCLFCTGLIACIVEFLIQKFYAGSRSLALSKSVSKSPVKAFITNNDHIRLISIILILTSGRLISAVFPELMLPWQLETSLNVYIFFESGIIAGKYIKKEAPLKTAFPDLVSGLAFLLLGVFVFSFGISGTYSMRTDEYSNFLLFTITAFIEIAGMLLLCRGIHSAPLIDYCGQNSLVVLLWNKFPVLLFQTIIPAMSILKNPDTVKAVLISVIPALLTVLICIIGGHIQAILFPWSLGKKRKG